MYHRNIIGVNAAKYTKDSPLAIKAESSTPVLFSSSAAAFSARLTAGRTYYLNARFLGGEWGAETADGRKAELYILVNGSRVGSGKPGAFKASVSGDAYIRILCTGEGEYSFCDFSVVESSKAVDYAPNPDAVDAGDGEIKVYRPKGRHTDGTGSALGIFPLLSSSVRKKELMGTDTVTLQWDDTCEDWETPLAIPLGSYVVVDGTAFRCLTQYQPTQSNELVWHYEVEFHSPVSALSAKPFFFYMEDLCETDFSINGVFKEFADALATAIQRSTGETWTIVAPDNLGSRALSFSESTIFDAIGDIAEEFDVEWLASGTTLTFIKDATNSDTRTLSVGDDIAAPSASGGTDEYFNRYYAFGSTRNIVRTDYNTLNASVTSLSEPRLKLPTAGWTDDDGTSYAGCPGGYVDYDDGALADDGERNACVKVYDDIYPQSDLSVSSVSVTKKKDENGEQYPVYTLKLTSKSGGGVFTVKKSTYNKDSNPDGMLISGLNVSVNFTSGLLQGRELELSVSADGKELTIVPDTSDSIMIPNDIVLPKVGDTCIVFNIRMPDSYRVQAERRLQKKLLEDIAKAHAEGAQLTLTSYPSAGVTGIDVGDKLVIRNGASEQTTRCVSFEQCIDIPSSWTITTGETAKTSKVRTLTEDVGKMGGEAAKASKSAAKANREAWKSSQELLDQVFDPDGEFFTERVKPLVVETANLTVGTKSQQFVIDNLLFGFDNGTAEGVAAYFYAKAIDSSVTPSLQHYAIDPDGVRTWRLNKSYTLSYGSSDKSTATPFTLSSDVKGCYIYAVCQRFDGVSANTELNGRVMLSDRQITAETPDDTGNYYFLLGMLSSEITTDSVVSRSVTLTFGQTTVNGRYVRTGRIESVDGGTYFDLDAGEIGGNIKFNADSAATKSVIDSIVSGNDTVKAAVSTANSANATANTASKTANSAVSTANAASSTANSANATANSTKLALDNFQAGTRNYVKGAATATRTITGGTAQKSWEFPLVDGASGMTFASDSSTFAWVSYFVDGWTEDYAPTTSNANIGKTTGGSNNWDWYYGSAGVGKGYVQVNATTRRYWYKYRTAGYTFLRLFVYTSPNTMVGKSAVIYKPMVSFGSALADWQEAPEDTAESISAAQATANTAKTTADTASKAAEEASAAATTAARNLIKNSIAVLQSIGIYPDKSYSKQSTADGVRLNYGSDSGIPGNRLEYVADNYTLTDTLSGDICTQVLIASDAAPTEFAISHYTRSPSAHHITNGALRQVDSTHWLGYAISHYGGTPVSDHKEYVRVPDFYVKAGNGSTYLEFSQYKIAKSGIPTAWSEAPEDTDYLRQSLQEATEAQTSITGGLILSKLIGVKSSAGVVVSGINGTDSAVGNGTPMLWAGAASKDTWNNAAFRVYNSGHVDMGDVSITSAGADGRLTLSEGDIMLSKSSGATTSLTSKAMGSLASALGKAGGNSVDVNAMMNGKNISVNETIKAVSGRKGGITVKTYTAASTETLTLFTAPYTGKCTITAAAGGNSSLSASATGIMTITNDSDIVATGNTAEKFIKFTLSPSTGNRSITINGVYKNGTKISGTTNFDIVNGAVYTASVTCSNNITLSADTNYSGKGDVTFNTNIAVKGNLSASGSLAAHLVSTEYVNKYYADGYMLFQNTGGTDSTLRYAGMTSADATVMQMRSGSSLMKFTADGLMQSLNGGGTFVRPPLLFRVTYGKTAYAYSATCINLGKDYGCKRDDTGKFTLTHSLGTNNYMAFAQTVHSSNQSSQWYDFAKIISKSSTTITVWIFDRDGSIRDDDCEVAIFRW